MVESLDAARHTARDLPDGPPLEVAWKVYTGRRGRPRTVISAPWLAQASAQRKKPGIAPLVGSSTRTVRRRQLELGLATPGRPVVSRTQLPDGGTEVVYNSGPSLEPAMTDQDVDAAVAAQLEIFPNFGRSMMYGALQTAGYNIPRARVQQAYDRLQGGPSTSFGNRRIHRRSYCVAGPNSLWHHDGQHGMYRLDRPEHVYS